MGLLIFLKHSDGFCDFDHYLVFAGQFSTYSSGLRDTVLRTFETFMRACWCDRCGHFKGFVDLSKPCRGEVALIVQFLLRETVSGSSL